MAHNVKCYYCGQTFDRDKEPFIQIQGTRRYAHKNCQLETASKETQERLALEDYVKKLFKMDYVHPNIQKQINEYTSQMGFTLSGIRSTLFYYFDILNNKPILSNPTIGIVPYVYPQAKEYYYKIYKAKQLNENKDINNYKTKEISVTIRAPEREPLRRRELFTFLDEEVKDGE